MPAEHAETTPATLSTSESVLSKTPPCITVTLAELARALDQMGSIEPVSATYCTTPFFNYSPRRPQQGLRLFRVSQTMTSMLLYNIQRILQLLKMTRKAKVLLFSRVRSNPTQRYSAIKRYDVGCWKWRRLRFPTASHHLT